MLALAGAAGAAGAPPPSLQSPVLAQGDLPGAMRIASNRTVEIAGYSIYVRTFVSSAGVVVSEAVLEKDADAAAAEFGSLRSVAASPTKRRALAREFVSLLSSPRLRNQFGVTATIDPRSVVVERVSVGRGEILMLVSFSAGGKRVALVVAITQVDRVLAFLATGGPVAAKIAALIRAEDLRLRRAFTVLGRTPPAIRGTARAGSTLVADEGTWRGAPATYSYVWERCDVAPIAGATGRTYMPTSAESGSTLRVVVTASNSVSSARAASVRTAAVP